MTATAGPDREHPHWCLCSECSDARADFAEEPEIVAALARELAACRLALLNERTDKETAQQEAAELRDARTASMADALTATHATRLSMFRGAGR
jgi:hypothetical protein